MSNPKATFATIDPSELASVAGGRRAATSSFSDTRDRMMDMLSDIESAIKDLGRNQNSGSDAMSQLMPILALSLLNQPAPAPQQPQVIYTGGKGKKGW